MRFDPATRTLWTDDGQLIKRLSCHRPLLPGQLRPEPGTGHWHCDACRHPVLDTARFTEAQLQARVAADPGTCLLVRRGQPNLDILD